ncbi:V-set and transmembrane domain-containing protein 4-like [Clupea harengus]|uniref:V-set and transmembrane domain-containing protein 4-like n=1 Tax=Clupea harengus TaxID=7950 RepID=A0A6P8FAX1_CLUHA|nr:V-set and transmembrane domain-containing protein 4-like [Clupea harengus]
MEVCGVFVALLASVLLRDVCSAINVTVVPSPVAMAAEGSNVTLTCRVGQRRRSGSLPVVRWMFVPEHGGEEILVARVNMRRAKFYGNYTKSFSAPKLRLTVVKQGHTYELLLLDAAPGDCGTYTCRAQEFRTHKGRWKASTNSSASTELKVHIHPASGPRDPVWSLFEDVYLCAVLICSVGLVCVCMFTIVVCCQFLQRKRRLKENYHLVKSPQNSSGETVTSVVSLSPALPKKERKYKNRKFTDQQDTPPEIPAKAPIGEKMRKPKLIKVPPRNLLLPKIVEESLTYAELELVKPPPRPSRCTSTQPVAPEILCGVYLKYSIPH